MVDAALLKGLVKALVLPPTGPLLVVAAGLAIVARRWRAGRILAWSGVALLWALSTPAVAFLLLSLVDRWPPLDLENARNAQAIVILGGGVRRHAAEYGGDTLGQLTLERVRYGARVARATKLPVLVTGGAVFGGEPEASLMRAALEGEFGVPVRWAETQSRNTHENALRSAQILAKAGIDRVVLVAHSFDMPRAKAEFAAQGIDAIPAPTGIPSMVIDTPLDVLPSLGALQGSYLALYEILANAWRRVSLAFDGATQQHASFALPASERSTVQKRAVAGSDSSNRPILATICCLPLGGPAVHAVGKVFTDDPPAVAIRGYWA
ncbi:MAG TPA: YdcF family protein [Casimicrobiaceae bacterium]|nr:YdcF family protein [Casimicrobiaceae bacterium]